MFLLSTTRDTPFLSLSNGNQGGIYWGHSVFLTSILQRTLPFPTEGMNETESFRKSSQPTGDTPFFPSPTTDTPVEKHVPRTTGTARTRRNRPYKFSRFSRISRLKLHRTLRLKSMNREQRERHEQGETDYTNFRSFRVFRG